MDEEKLAFRLAVILGAIRTFVIAGVVIGSLFILRPVLLALIAQ